MAKFTCMETMTVAELVEVREIIDREIKSREDSIRIQLETVLAAEIKKVLRGGYDVIITDGEMYGGDIQLTPADADNMSLMVIKHS